MKKFFVSLLGYSPFILLLIYNRFEQFAEQNRSILLIGTMAAMFFTMYYLKEDAVSIDSICALLVLLIGFERFYNMNTSGKTFVSLFEGFLFIVCGVGYMRHMMSAHKNKDD